MTLSSGLDETVDSSEVLARFVTSTSQYNASGPKGSLFLPQLDTQETSVFRQSAEPPDRLWSIADAVIRNRRVCGAALLTAGKVRFTGLEVQPDEPPDRHAVIINWPQTGDDLVMRKARQKEIALELASASTLVLRM